MKYNLAYRYKIYPNEIQANLILQTFGCVRFVCNKILAKADETYKLKGKNKIVTPTSLKTEFQFLKEVDSLALANTQMNVKTAFTNFFQKRTDFSKFKSKKTAKKSYSTTSVNKDNCIKLPKLGLVRVNFIERYLKTIKLNLLPLVKNLMELFIFLFLLNSKKI